MARVINAMVDAMARVYVQWLDAIARVYQCNGLLHGACLLMQWLLQWRLFIKKMVAALALVLMQWLMQWRLFINAMA